MYNMLMDKESIAEKSVKSLLLPGVAGGFMI